MSAPLIYLASRSARRRQLLGHLGVEFRSLDTEVEERHLAGETPSDMAMRLAADKAAAGVGLLADTGENVAEGSVVLAADTLVDLDGLPLGKPTCAEEAKQMLGRLCGREHRILTAVAVAPAGSLSAEDIRVELAATELSMREPAPGWIDYCARHPEALRSAGAYAIQGAAAPMVESINGCFYTVVGLPLFVTAGLLSAHGIELRPGAASSEGVFGSI